MLELEERPDTHHPDHHHHHHHHAIGIVVAELAVIIGILVLILHEIEELEHRRG